eukprot:COSAG06_NODE_55947_length_287_cov_0.808511_1_plen_33_part_01
MNDLLARSQLTATVSCQLSGLTEGLVACQCHSV